MSDMSYLRVSSPTERPEPFREPDLVTDGGRGGIWYGPGGRKSKVCTEVEGVGFGWIVREYCCIRWLMEENNESLRDHNGHHKPTILCIETWVDDDEADGAREAAALGVEKIAYWGGTEKMVYVKDIP